MQTTYRCRILILISFISIVFRMSIVKSMSCKNRRYWNFECRMRCKNQCTFHISFSISFIHNNKIGHRPAQIDQRSVQRPGYVIKKSIKRYIDLHTSIIKYPGYKEETSPNNMTSKSSVIPTFSELRTRICFKNH